MHTEAHSHCMFQNIVPNMHQCLDMLFKLDSLAELSAAERRAAESLLAMCADIVEERAELLNDEGGE